MKNGVTFFRAGSISDKLQQLHPESNESFRWDNIGDASLFAEISKGSACYATDRKLWYVYDGARWFPDAGDVAVDEMVKYLARELQKYALHLDQPLLQSNYGKHVFRWAQRRTRDTILRDARSIHSVKSDIFDLDPWSLNVQNGTIDLQTGELRPHRPEDMISRLAPVEYHPEVRCERWEQFIEEVADGDMELARFLQRIAGYFLSGSTDEECAFILLGESARNGKTTYCVTLQKLLGDYAATADPVTLAAKKFQSASGPSEDLARLEGRRLVVLPEPDEGMQFSASRLKSITGGDNIVARRPYEESVEFRPQFKLLLAANSLPRCTDPAVFLSDRLHVVRFNRSFPPNEQDHGLKRYFAQQKNLTGILNWAVEGLQAYLTEGLNLPDVVRAATEAYAEQEAGRPIPTLDTVGQFLDEAMEVSFTSEVTSTTAYLAYVDWCEKNAYTNASIQRFGRAVKERLPVVRKRPANGGEKASVIVGYRLKGA